MFCFFFFFFQAEDGIRDVAVTGVQTCALPISGLERWHPGLPRLIDRRAPTDPRLLRQQPRAPQAPSRSSCAGRCAQSPPLFQLPLWRVMWSSSAIHKILYFRSASKAFRTQRRDVRSGLSVRTFAEEILSRSNI